eukprot:CAMPEP_0176492078 /NCGR_PEP_ID=MMETSP0200_2-20121128/8779_1 /TAXON_ID=947934 /ORGANISM="Chaetoceros sp., Strain GSL56" /LENGTH=383 /DNA_ID=CAMNT_0017889561 /DNA_START=508 /DNA_END=1659 /DNA_ORIENTATION=+
MTAWAKSHPGGSKILEKFHNRDATKAFFAAGHSQYAIDMLNDFLIKDESTSSNSNGPASTSSISTAETIQNALETVGSINKPEEKKYRGLSRVRSKLFTKEDPIGIHKYCGIFVLLHFAYRFLQSFFGDPAAGMGNRLMKGSSFISLACIIPHTVLSLSSLIFHTVPRERIVGRPMIWQEFRAHNIIFGIRSIVCTILGWFAVYKPEWRKVSVIGSSASVLLASWAADVATEKLRENDHESTTATMPYWDGCSVETQKRFKTFYAFSQFMATMACLMTLNPAWPLLVLLPIQLASLLMTLVRKGLLSAKGYHIGYTVSLCLPYISAFRSYIYSGAADVPLLTAIATILFNLRRRGLNKYLLWGCVVLARITVGDNLLDWKVWT